VTSPFRRRRREEELDEEIRTHFRMAVEERVARGEPREEAERAVRREFGNDVRVREVTRTMWGGMWMDRLAQDVRYGLRSLRRDPGFALAAAVLLTVGIGANAIVFTLAKGVLFDDPPGVTAPDELVAVTWTLESGSEQTWGYPDYEYVRDESSAFAGVMAYQELMPTAIASPQGASQADARVVSANFFDVLGTPMAQGRGFLAEEGRTPGSHPVVVLSHGFWQRYLGSDPTAVGASLSLNGRAFSVVGIAPREFRGVSPVEAPADIYVPLMMMGTLSAGAEQWFERVEGERAVWFRLVARLREGVPIEAAQANMEALYAGLDDDFRAWWSSTGVGVTPFRLGVTADYRFPSSDGEELRRMLGFLAIVVAAVLLIACANVALLLLARAPGRRGEMGVRSALGAGRHRIVRQLLTEGVLLASIGGLGGFLVAYWGSAFVARLMPYAFAADFTPDGVVLLYAALITLAVTAIFGLAPAFQMSRSDIAGILRGETRTTARGRGRNVLVVAQVAVSLVLIAGAGLFVRSLVAARSVELGFEPHNRLVLSVGLHNHGYDEVTGRAFLDEVLQRVDALPGVDAAAVTARPPFRGGWTSTALPEGVEGGTSVTLAFNRAGPSYFEAMGIPIVAGRAIDASDTEAAPPVLVVNETTAERFWPGQETVGKTILWRDRTWTIVGVAADAKYYTIGDQPYSQVYVSHHQDYDGNATFVVRTSVPPTEVAGEVEAIIRDVDDGVAIYGVETLQDLVDGQVSTYRAMAVLVGTFGIIALLMAALGLYGVLAYLVGQSAREIGIRMALGAHAGEVAYAVVRRGAWMAVIGVVVGLGAAWASAGLLRQMLFGVEPQDPLTLAAVAAVLLAVTLLASWLPARRAARVDPVVALREA
jgi:predicted permease